MIAVISFIEGLAAPHIGARAASMQEPCHGGSARVSSPSPRHAPRPAAHPHRFGAPGPASRLTPERNPHLFS
jgi:hypothetical protein